jgi:hypothetical protein
MLDNLGVVALSALMGVGVGLIFVLMGRVLHTPSDSQTKESQ